MRKTKRSLRLIAVSHSIRCSHSAFRPNQNCNPPVIFTTLFSPNQHKSKDSVVSSEPIRFSLPKGHIFDTDVRLILNSALPKRGMMISFHKVNKQYGDLHLLNNIDLHISKGEVVVVRGSSGSGKSTLIRCINSLEPIQERDFYVDNMNVNDPDTNMTLLRAEIGFVFQQFNLYPHVTVLENVICTRGRRSGNIYGCRSSCRTALKNSLILLKIGELKIF